MSRSEELRFTVGDRVGEVSALLSSPAEPTAVLVLAHGAGAGMRHRFMEAISERLVDRGIATFRYQFPYIETGRRRPDPPGVLEATVRAAVRTATDATSGFRGGRRAAGGGGSDATILAGGKSMGGRMTSQAAAKGWIDDVKGLVFFGFPLHAPGKPSADRGAHLADVPQPLLFLQGTRDTFSKPEFLGPLLEELGRSARLHTIDGADHSFQMTKSSGRTDAEVLDELADVTRDWAAGV